MLLLYDECYYASEGLECCGMNCGELVQDIILEVSGCIVVAMNAWILQQHYILIATCVRFLGRKCMDIH